MEIVQPGGSGTGTALTVTDGTHTVTPVSTIDFTSGAVVSNGGGGIANVSVSATGYQQPTGTVNGTNQTFIFTIAPNVISVDGVTKQKVASDGTVNWTGTTTTVLAVAPTYDVFGVT